MKSFAVILLSTLLCVQPVYAMPVKDPILYADAQKAAETEAEEMQKKQEEEGTSTKADETDMEKQEEENAETEADIKKQEEENAETETDAQGTEGIREDGTGVQSGTEISAPSAVLMESSTGQVIYEKDADTQRPPASVTKVMTLLLIFDALEDGKIKLEDEVTVSEYAASMGGSQVFLEPGEVQTVETMIKCISVASANDACVSFHNSRQFRNNLLLFRYDDIINKRWKM